VVSVRSVIGEIGVLGTAAAAATRLIPFEYRTPGAPAKRERIDGLSRTLRDGFSARHLAVRPGYAGNGAALHSMLRRIRAVQQKTENGMGYVFAPAPVTAVPVVGTDDQFAVRRIYCVGRNYEAHAREMGHDPDREPPFFFAKPADAVLYVAPGATGEFPYPAQSNNVHFEMELVAAIGKAGKNISADNALDHVYGYALGLDMTRRDLQAEAKKLGRPWDTAKGFDHSAPLGPIHPVSKVGHVGKGAIWLTVNGEEKQRSDVSQLIWSVAETIAYLSTLFELQPGDLIFTGTPEGVGAIVQGDLMKGGVDGLGEFSVRVV
jgi:fumarylpyruvate hydrolase